MSRLCHSALMQSRDQPSLVHPKPPAPALLWLCPCTALCQQQDTLGCQELGEPEGSCGTCTDIVGHSPVLEQVPREAPRPLSVPGGSAWEEGRISPGSVSQSTTQSPGRGGLWWGSWPLSFGIWCPACLVISIATKYQGHPWELPVQLPDTLQCSL